MTPRYQLEARVYLCLAQRRPVEEEAGRQLAESYIDERFGSWPAEGHRKRLAKAFLDGLDGIGLTDRQLGNNFLSKSNVMQSDGLRLRSQLAMVSATAQHELKYRDQLALELAVEELLKLDGLCERHGLLVTLKKLHYVGRAWLEAGDRWEEQLPVEAQFIVVFSDLAKLRELYADWKAARSALVGA